LERSFSPKNLKSANFSSMRRSSWNPRQRRVGPGEWGLSLKTLSTSRFGLMQSRFPKDRQGRRMRTAQRRREQQRATGQISFSSLAWQIEPVKFTSECNRPRIFCCCGNLRGEPGNARHRASAVIPPRGRLGTPHRLRRL